MTVAGNAGNAAAGRARPSERLLYLDSSALVKIVLPEAESQALVSFLPAWPHRVSSALARVEVLRAVARASMAESMDDTLRDAEQLLAHVSLLAMSDTLLAAAAALKPVTLRTLDAIHLATALSLGPDVAGFVTYDGRLAEAAQASGLTIYAPR